MPTPSVQLNFPPGILYAPGSIGKEIKVESSPDGGPVLGLCFSNWGAVWLLLGV